jgi:hypothetical protein
MAFATLQQLVSNVRSALTDTHAGRFTDLEIIQLLSRAWREYANEGEFLEGTQTTDVTSGTAAYTVATDIGKIIRVTCYGRRCAWIDYRELATLNSDGQAITQTGKPKYYSLWGETITLFPIPDTTTSSTLIINYWKIPVDFTLAQLTTDLQTLEVVPEAFGPLQDFATSECWLWLGNPQMARFYFERWNEARKMAKESTMKYRDRFQVVKDDDNFYANEFSVE